MTGGQRWSSATASHILFKGSDALARAVEVMAEIESGRSFEETAADLSACPSGRRAGGSLGSFSPGKMVPAFDAVVFDASTVVNKLYTVETSHGTHILRVNARTGIKSDTYQPEKGLQLGDYKSLTTVDDDGTDASALTTDGEAPPQGAKSVALHSSPTQAASAQQGHSSQMTTGSPLAGTNAAALTATTARCWALQEQDRRLAVELLAKSAGDGPLTGDESRRLRAALSQLVLTLAS